MKEADIEAVKTCLQPGFGLECDDQPPLCRETQFNKISSIVRECINEAKGGGAYLSGVPGTGKSMTAHAVLRSICNSQIAPDSCPAVVSINCLALESARCVYGCILQGYHDYWLNPTREVMYPCKQDPEDSHFQCLPWLQARKELEALIINPSERKASRKRRRGSYAPESSTRKLLLLLDEADCLVSKDASILHGLYRTAVESKSLVLLGAANSLDLTERVMNSLSDEGCKPRLVEFPAYRATEACQVLKQRLSILPAKLIDDVAIELCAKKVAAHSGDMRHVLETCASTISNAIGAENDSEGKKLPLILGPREILQSLRNAQDGRSSSNLDDLVRDLPKLQQILLFAIWQQSLEASKLQKRIENEKSSHFSRSAFGEHKKLKRTKCHDNKAPKMADPMKLGNIYTKFMNVCCQLHLGGSSFSEAQQLIVCLGDEALVEIQKKKTTKDAQVSLRIDQADLEQTFADHVLFRGIIAEPLLGSRQ